MFTSKMHGYVDYILGIVLLLAPYIFNFSEVGVASYVAQGIGIVVLGQSLLTNYELGLIKVLPFKVHLMMDMMASLFLAASPFLLGFNDYPVNVWLPHVAAGIGYLFITLMTTDTVPERAKAG